MSADEGGASLLARARTLAADAAAAEVADALEERGVRSILLKGPVLAQWLYPDAERDYADADVLVAPHEHPLAEEVLSELGYARVPEHAKPPRRGMLHSQPWGRPGGHPHIDLHRTLFGLGVGPEKVWAEVSGTTDQMSLAGTTVSVLDPPALALLVANHAAQHEGQPTKAIEDLRRAVARAPLDTWRAAAAMAERLNGTPTMSLGLSLVPGGDALARRIGLVDPRLARAATTAGSHARLAIGIERLWQQKGLANRLRLIGRELVPSRDFIYGWTPIARRGRLGMAVAYLWRPVWLLGSAAPGLLGWLRYRAGARP